MPKSPRMTLDEILDDMRLNGMSMGKDLLIACLRDGVFPFAHIVVNSNGRANHLIMRKDYEAWAEDYLYQYQKEA